MQTYIPVDRAAARYGLDRKTLIHSAISGTIDAIEIADNGNGGIAVAEDDVRTIAIGRDDTLRGKGIRVTKAAEKYEISHQSLNNWAEYGYIRVIEQGPKLLILDEADVKQAAAIFKRAKKKTGSSLKAGWVLKRSMQYLRN